MLVACRAPPWYSNSHGQSTVALARRAQVTGRSPCSRLSTPLIPWTVACRSRVRSHSARDPSRAGPSPLSFTALGPPCLHGPLIRLWRTSHRHTVPGRRDLWRHLEPLNPRCPDRVCRASSFGLPLLHIVHDRAHCGVLSHGSVRSDSEGISPSDLLRRSRWFLSRLRTPACAPLSAVHIRARPCTFCAQCALSCTSTRRTSRFRVGRF